MIAIRLYLLPILLVIFSFVLAQEALKINQQYVEKRLHIIVKQHQRKVNPRAASNELTDSEKLTFKNLVDAFLLKHNLREMETKIVSNQPGEFVLNVVPRGYTPAIKRRILGKYNYILAFMNDLSNIPFNRNVVYKDLEMGMEGKSGFELSIDFR